MAKRSKQKKTNKEAKGPSGARPWDRPTKAPLHELHLGRAQRPNTKYLRQERGRGS